MPRPNCIGTITALLLIAFATLACSSGGKNPVAPPETSSASATNTKTGSARILWGVWDIHFDPIEMTAVAIPARNINVHYNVTPMLVPPACDDCVLITVNSFDPVTRIMDVDVALRNPSPIPGRDVRGILHTSDYGHRLTNPDNWTGLWDVLGGEDINPFRAFAKSDPVRKLGGYAYVVKKVYAGAYGFDVDVEAGYA